MWGWGTSGPAELCALNMGRGLVQAVACPPPPQEFEKGLELHLGSVPSAGRSVSFLSGVMQVRSLSSKAVLSDDSQGHPFFGWVTEKGSGFRQKYVFSSPYPAREDLLSLFTEYAQGLFLDHSACEICTERPSAQCGL